MSEIEEKIRSFSELQPNWDSYDAKPISKLAIEKAIELIPWLDQKFGADRVFAGPMPDGGIEFEFSGQGLDILISVNP